MRVAPETAAERLGTVANDLPQASKEMLAEIRHQNQASHEIVGPIPTTRTYVLWSPKSSGFPDTVKGNPELALYFSRVAFSADGSKALVYMGTMNWTDNTKSMGQYVLLRIEGAEWRIAGHSLVWGLH